MKSRSEHSTAGGQGKMEGVNMPASFRFAWRWMVGATVAATFSLLTLPGVGHAENIEICINNNGLIRGINLGVDACGPNQFEIDWVSIGPSGPTGATGVQGDFGPQGPPGLEGTPGGPGPAGEQGDAGPQGPQGVVGPTGATGPQGPMGQDGVRGPTGLTGVTGVMGPSGTPEDNISVFTGGTLGTFGAEQGTDLSQNQSNPFVLVMGPGNGSDSGATSANPLDVAVPMSEAGSAQRLFVNVDNDPGVDAVTGVPISFMFFLCNGNTLLSNCGLACVITDPDTTCRVGSNVECTGTSTPFSCCTGAGTGTCSQSYAVGDLMSLQAFADDFLGAGTNHANVKWSVTYDRDSLNIIAP
ncbi:MAG TPA: hypothetical protein VGR40_05430, partial [Candidatus Binatus sp.]|nr:hypothetical protein [Candidatus Binatus sp.]